MNHPPQSLSRKLLPHLHACSRAELSCNQQAQENVVHSQQTLPFYKYLPISLTIRPLPFFSMDTRSYYVRIGTLGSTSVQAASKWQAEDRVWTRVQAGEYGKLASQLTRKDISVA